MAFDNTITEYDLEANTKFVVQGLGAEQQDCEPDLAVDGLSDSVLSRFLGLLRLTRSRH